MDIEWAKDGQSGELFIDQSRPETVHAWQDRHRLELVPSQGDRARAAVGQERWASASAPGPGPLVHGPDELSQVQAGEVLVRPHDRPGLGAGPAAGSGGCDRWGGRHLPCRHRVARVGDSCVVGTGRATTTLPTGKLVTVSCAEGDEGRIYEGAVEFAREEIDPATTPHSPVPLLLNVANPDHAFALAQLLRPGSDCCESSS
jgi:pyruvate,water dikinase